MNGEKVINMNAGTKIDYEIMGNKIIFNDELMLNLEKYDVMVPNAYSIFVWMNLDVCVWDLHTTMWLKLIFQLENINM